MLNCAFLTISNTEGWFIDDDLVHEPLQKLGWNVHNVPWDKSVDWNAFDIVVIRSPWDYQAHLDQFLDVLKRIESSSAILLNGLELVQWNISKNYLFELENKGVQLVPGIKFKSLNKNDILSAFDTFQTSEIIIKPLIGANADHNYRIKKDSPFDFDRLEGVFQHREGMIQPFMDSVISEGEFSLMYFNGELSHVILKTAKPGDYRVQEEHGGGVIPIQNPEPLLVSKAAQVIKTLPDTPLYARVDLVRTPSDSFALMEFELIEPCLYFRFDENAASRFAKSIDDYWMEVKGRL
jgi:hypothetical protein